MIFVRSSVKPSGVGLTAVVIEDLPQTVYSGFLIRFRDKKRIDTNYKKYCFYENNFRKQIISASSVSANTNINQDNLKRLTLALPPTKTEQTSIANALSDADAWIQSLTRLIAKKRQIKQGAMQTLLTGRKRLPGFVSSKDYKNTEIGLLPEDWDVVSLGDNAQKIGSGITPKGGSSVYKEDGRHFMRSQNVGWGVLKLNDVAFIDEETHASFPASEIKNKDVLLNITGASIGRCTLATFEISGGNVNQHVCIIRTKDKLLDAAYLCRVLLSDIGQGQIDSFQAGGNREGLNFGQIKSFNIPLPPTMKEQTRIATILSDIDNEITALETKLAKAQKIKQGMMQNLLTGRVRLI